MRNLTTIWIPIGLGWPVQGKDDFNTLRPRQNCRHFADDTFKRIFLNENVRISIKISLKFVPKGPINNIPALVQLMAWRRPGDKPLTEPMVVRLLTHICVTRPQWVNFKTLNFNVFVWSMGLPKYTFTFEKYSDKGESGWQLQLE